MKKIILSAIFMAFVTLGFSQTPLPTQSKEQCTPGGSIAGNNWRQTLFFPCSFCYTFISSAGLINKSCNRDGSNSSPNTVCSKCVDLQDAPTPYNPNRKKIFIWDLRRWFLTTNVTVINDPNFTGFQLADILEEGTF